MDSLDAFLQSLGARLRCTQERRADVLDELAGHFDDRVAALMKQGHGRPSAERIALRELGAPQVLAFRLSRANGWSVTAFVLRQLWALGLALVAGLAALLSLEAMGPAAGLRPAHLLLLVPLAVYGFALGAVVRELYWAVALTNLVAIALGPSPEAATPLAAAALFFLAAVAGHWAWWPWLPRLAWGSGVLTVFVACLLPQSAHALTARDLLFGHDAIVGWLGVAAVWVPWLVARLLEALGERARSPRRVV